jgi:beta-lactamase class A
MTNLPRRSLLAAPLLGLFPAAQATAQPFRLPPTLPATLAALERRNGGRLGVAALDTATGQLLGHRTEERFALCSTFKLLLAAAVLQQIDAGRFPADRWVSFEGASAVPNSPVTDAHRTAGGMTALALAHATQTTSDNLAANLLMQLLGGAEGPQWLTQWLRTHGDPTTRLDRWEPEMNNVPAGEVRDTSSPAAMARTTAHLLTSKVLQPASRELLLQWMVDTRTGLQRLRAGLPQGWRAGDKTGTGWRAGQPDKINDVAITWPPGQAPWVIAAYYEAPLHQEAKLRERDVAVLAAVGRAVAQMTRR